VNGPPRGRAPPSFPFCWARVIVTLLFPLLQVEKELAAWSSARQVGRHLVSSAKHMGWCRYSFPYCKLRRNQLHSLPRAIVTTILSLLLSTCHIAAVFSLLHSSKPSKLPGSIAAVLSLSYERTTRWKQLCSPSGLSMLLPLSGTASTWCDFLVSFEVHANIDFFLKYHKWIVEIKQSMLY
jgi:hypothetical protein